MKNDILTVKETSVAIETIAGKITSLRNVETTKKGARVFRDGKIYSSSVVGNVSDEKIVKDTKEKAVVGIDYAYEVPKNKMYEFKSKEFSDIKHAEFVKEIQELEEMLKPFADKFAFTGKHKVENFEKVVESSEGIKFHKKIRSKSFSYIFKRVGSPNLIDGYFSTSGENIRLKKTIEHFKPYLDFYDKEVELTNGEYPIIFADPEANFYGKLLESFMPNKYFEGTALYSGKLGKKVFNEKISLIDNAYLPEFGIANMADDEGTLREKAELYLIENGVMKNVLADLRYSKKYDTPPTGNGKRSFDGGVSVGFNALMFKKGSRTTKEILNGLDRCIVSFMAFGGDFTDKGDYSTPVHLAYMVEKGKIIGRLPPFTLNTTVQTMFNEKFIEIASDDFFESNYNPSFFQKVQVMKN